MTTGAFWAKLGKVIPDYEMPLAWYERGQMDEQAEIEEGSAFADWQRFLGERWTTSTRDVAAVGARFERFGLHRFDSVQSIEIGVSEVSRAVALRRACERWDAPAIGPAVATATDRVRGVQWRLVLGHAAWEAFARGISASKSKPHECWPKVSASDFAHLVPPSGSTHDELRRWVEGEAQMRVAEYFGLFPNSWKPVEGWLIRGQPIVTHDARMALAATLRHATAHGMLSATKVADWGLVEAFEVLTSYLMAVIADGVAKLART